MTWCRDVATVLEYVHSKDVRHGDLSGRNLLLDAERRILLCDFSGSYIDGEKATILAEDGFRHPDKSEARLPTIPAELHSLGSLLYEIMTYTKPYEGVEEEFVLKRIAKREYPDVSEVLLGDVMMKCWMGVFGSAAEVAKAIAQTGIYTHLTNISWKTRADLLPRRAISRRTVTQVSYRTTGIPSLASR